MNVLVLMLVCQRVPGSTSLENINIYIDILCSKQMTGNLNYPVILRISKLCISSFLHGKIPRLNSFPLWFRKSDVPLFTGFSTWNKQPKTHPTWGKQFNKSIETY